MSVTAENSKDINSKVLSIGNESIALIQKFLTKRSTREELISGLTELKPGEILSGYWDDLTADAKYVPHWKVLQTLKGLVEELDYQLGEYGESTLYDDIKEIALNLKKISLEPNEKNC